MVCQYLWSTFYGLVVAINELELRRRGCSGALRVHVMQTRARARVSVYIARARGDQKKHARDGPLVVHAPR